MRIVAQSYGRKYDGRKTTGAIMARWLVMVSLVEAFRYSLAPTVDDLATFDGVTVFVEMC